MLSNCSISDKPFKLQKKGEKKRCTNSQKVEKRACSDAFTLGLQTEIVCLLRQVCVLWVNYVQYK